MRSSIYQRRARANDLRISVRDVQDPAEDSDLSDSEDEGEPDSPSPTSPNFPDGTSDTSSSSISPSSTQSISTDINSSATQTDSVTAGAAQDDISDTPQAQVSDGGNTMPGMSKGGAIAFGTIGGVVIVAALIFIIWKFGRRRNRASGGLFSRFTPSRFRRMEEPQGTVDYGPPGRTQSGIMDDLMAAAYAAEDGNASQYGGFVDEKRQLGASMYAPQVSQPVPVRQSNAPDPRASSNSLYVNQLMSGFYKGARADGLAVPANARMPPPAAPSVAGQTEVTTTTESTWKTWGWSQPKKPKETWVDKCVRLGGLR
ncbi:hypothetical protein F4818DRAFT_15457 [Hypoxylon cercidicola]|nr:hypothetical protein F4818DRAFT_15457 [Hypoxylon cercidicola]